MTVGDLELDRALDRAWVATHLVGGPAALLLLDLVEHGEHFVPGLHRAAAGVDLRVLLRWPGQHVSASQVHSFIGADPGGCWCLAALLDCGGVDDLRAVLGPGEQRTDDLDPAVG